MTFLCTNTESHGVSCQGPWIQGHQCASHHPCRARGEARHCVSVFSHMHPNSSFCHFLLPLPLSSVTAVMDATTLTYLALMQCGSKSVQKHQQNPHCRVGTFISVIPVSLQVVPTNILMGVPCFLKIDPSALCPFKKAQIPPVCYSMAAGPLSSCPSLAPHDTHDYLLTSMSNSTCLIGIFTEDV